MKTMDNIEKKIFIYNAVIMLLKIGSGELHFEDAYNTRKLDIEQNVPRYLYKYRTFSERSIDMLDKNLMYLSTPAQLDDQFEGCVSSNVDTFLEQYVADVVNNDSLIKIEHFFENGRNTGIHSLSADGYNQVMWNMYANNNSGFCIEYDLSQAYEMQLCLLPVMYKADRSIPDMELFAHLVFDESMFGISREEYIMCKSYDFLCTKNSEWEFQKEWRIIGNPNTEMSGPRVNRVFVGMNADQNNLERLKALADKRGFELLRQSASDRDLKIEYKP